MEKESVEKIIEMLDSRDASEIALARTVLEQVRATLPRFHSDMISDGKAYMVATLFLRGGLLCIENNHLWLKVPDSMKNQPLLYMCEKEMPYREACAVTIDDPIYGERGPLAHVGLCIVSIHPKVDSADALWFRNPTRTSTIIMK